MKGLIVLFFVVNLYASKGGPEKEAMKGEVFADKKKMALERIDQRLKSLGDSKACITAATDMKGLKECRKQEHEARKANKEKFKGLRDAKRAEWKGKREKMKGKKPDVKNVESH